MRINRGIFIFILAFVVTLTGCSGKAAISGSEPGSASADTGDTKKVIRVGLNNRPNPPYLFTDDHNEPIGYTIDYYKELEKRLPEYTFQYESVDQEALAIGVDTGKYAFAGNFFRNPERESKYLFGASEFGYYITALVTKNNRDDIRTLDDLPGKKLTPFTPTSGLLPIIRDFNLRNPDRQIEIEITDKNVIADDMKLVASGRYDALFTNVNMFENANKQLQLDLKIAGIISKEPIWIMYNKNQEELAHQIDAVTAELKQDGTLSKISEKWLGVDFFGSLESVNEGYQFLESEKKK
jgi:L-cystine transport system substrate-binding protein